MHKFERKIILDIIDNYWCEHLAAMDYLRQGIHLRGYAQKNPKQEYKREAFEMFQAMWAGIEHTVASFLISIHFESTMPDEEQTDPPISASNNDDNDDGPEALQQHGIIVHRNDPCPCGSGKKYKQCYGRIG